MTSGVTSTKFDDLSERKKKTISFTKHKANTMYLLLQVTLTLPSSAKTIKYQCRNSTRYESCGVKKYRKKSKIIIKIKRKVKGNIDLLISRQYEYQYASLLT